MTKINNKQCGKQSTAYASPSSFLSISLSLSIFLFLCVCGSSSRIAFPRVELAALCNVTLRYVTFWAPLNAHDMCKTIAFSISFHFISFRFDSRLVSSRLVSFRWRVHQQQQRPLTAKARNKINLTKRIE